MNDEERVRRALRSGGMMLGPLERYRCEKHKSRWIMFRWIWDAGPGGDISGGSPEVVRSCGECERLALEADLYDE